MREDGGGGCGRSGGGVVGLGRVGALAWGGAAARTQNFIGEAPTPQIAQQVGQYAEHYRREKALQWLGQEMPPWPEPCPGHVTVTMSGAGGRTAFSLSPRPLLRQEIKVGGPPRRPPSPLLPHSRTPTASAHPHR